MSVFWPEPAPSRSRTGPVAIEEEDPGPLNRSLCGDRVLAASCAARPGGTPTKEIRRPRKIGTR